MSTTQTKLLPCPFCGCRATIRETHKGHYVGQCADANCDVTTRTELTIEEAAKWWNTRTQPKLLGCPITSVYDDKGGVDIKIGDFVYVHINYDYRYTDNASRAILASKIVEMITPTNKVPTCECGVKERKE